MAQIRGVNLGGWFVLESWIKPSLFEGLEDCFDETCFMKKANQSRQKLKEHYETFITEEDFKYLSSIGVKHVRLPIPWWYKGTDLYMSSSEYIHQAFNWANTYHINILLDLHTAPGCQNGFDNGGIKDVMEWHKHQNHIDLTVKILEDIASEFHHYESFYGIEVLNEPFLTIDLDVIINFYENAYHRIRKITKKPIVFHDAFRPEDAKFLTFFKGKENIIFDLHLYHCFDDKLNDAPIEKHIDLIMNKRIPMIKALSKHVNIIIGEWSLGLRHIDADDEYQKALILTILGHTQLYAYEQGYGYYFWNYKIERESHLEWDYKRLIHKQILPIQEK